MTATHEHDTVSLGGNGHDRGPKCAVHEAAIVELRGTTRDTRDTLERLTTRVTEEFLGVFGALSRVETKIDRVVEGIAIGQVRPRPLPSLDWDPAEDTLHGQDDPAIAATIWAARAREASDRVEAMHAELREARAAMAAAQARLDERARRSDRVRATSVVRWRVVAGVITAIVTSSAGTLLLARLLGVTP